MGWDFRLFAPFGTGSQAPASPLHRFTASPLHHANHDTDTLGQRHGLARRRQTPPQTQQKHADNDRIRTKNPRPNKGPKSYGKRGWTHSKRIDIKTSKPTLTTTALLLILHHHSSYHITTLPTTSLLLILHCNYYTTLSTTPSLFILHIYHNTPLPLSWNPESNMYSKKSASIYQNFFE